MLRGDVDVKSTTTFVLTGDFLTIAFLRGLHVISVPFLEMSHILCSRTFQGITALYR